jgi:dTDP-4-amino-4,6-dideoxygalactose transaminase
MDETKLKKAVSEKTKVIVPVHYAGVSCEMDAIMEIAREHGIYVVEDAAQGVNSRYKDKYLGTIGDLGTYSFHETKNYICGEGGAIVINNEKFIERAEIIREKGTNRKKFFRGEVDKYTWVDIGSSYLPLISLPPSFMHNLKIWSKLMSAERTLDYYYKALIPLVNDGKIRLLYISDECKRTAIFFYIILKDETTRNGLIDHLKSNGILSVFHYIPLHLSQIGRSMGYKEGQLPVTESMSGRLLRLPFYYDMTKEEQAEIVGCIKSFKF